MSTQDKNKVVYSFTVDITEDDILRDIIAPVVDEALNDVEYSVNFDCDVPNNFYDEFPKSIGFDPVSIYNRDGVKEKIVADIKKQLTKSKLERIKEYAIGDVLTIYDTYADIDKIEKGLKKEIKAKFKEYIKPLNDAYKQARKTKKIDASINVNCTQAELDEITTMLSKYKTRVIR